MSEEDQETLRVSHEVVPISTPSGAIDHGRFVPGALLGSRYRIVALLGKGGMGEVYRADDLLLGQPVALKFLPQRVSGNANALARLLSEVRIARQISHPNVCRVYDVGQLDGEHFISMEYVQGEDLRSLLHRIGRFGPEKGVAIARQICAGLAAAHDRGVLHRDLKPANVMIDERGVARITDFGLAVLADSAEAQRREGTPAYMSPEQLEGTELTTLSDIYSLGLVLYEIFSGRMLFEAKTITELLELRRSTTAKSVRLTNDIDPVIERVIQRCLAASPALRPKNAALVAAALPGGDPLAAALAAGETPSPELVAAAGEHQGISARAALLSLLAIAVLMVALIVVKSRLDVASVAGIHDPPDAMALRARDLLARFGYRDRPGDRAWSYQADRRESSVYFWYRESRDAIVPVSFFRRDVYVARSGSVSEAQPAIGDPGDVAIRMDPDGRLLQLRVVPSRAQQPGPAFDWNQLLEAAQFDRSTLRDVPPAATVVPFDHRAAWILRDAKSGREQRVEAASLGGRPVSFEIGEPQPVRGRPGAWVGLVFLLTTLSIVAILARRNLRSGRIDSLGAKRTATVGALAIFLTWLLGADHVTTTSEIGLLIEAIAWASMVWLVLFCGYIAIEPTLRRRWPHSLVSWTRLLRGEWRDPIVGRDILVGIIGGCVNVLLDVELPGVFAAHPRPYAISELVMLNGPRQAVGELLSVVPRSIMDSMAMLITIIVIWMLVRRLWLAGAIFFVIQTVRFGLTSISVSSALTGVAFSALMIFLPRRFGYLALAVTFLTDAILQITPVLLPPLAWHTTVAVLGFGLVAAFAVGSAIVSLAGKPLISADFLES